MMYELYDEAHEGYLGPAAFDRSAHQHPLLVQAFQLEQLDTPAAPSSPTSPAAVPAAAPARPSTRDCSSSAVASPSADDSCELPPSAADEAGDQDHDACFEHSAQIDADDELPPKPGSGGRAQGFGIMFEMREDWFTDWERTREM